MSAVLKLVNDFFQGVAERGIGAGKIKCKKLMSATAAQYTLPDTFGSERIATDATEGILDGFNLVPTVSADHTKLGLADYVLTQSAATGKDNTQEGINDRCDSF